MATKTLAQLPVAGTLASSDIFHSYQAGTGDVQTTQTAQNTFSGSSGPVKPPDMAGYP